MTVVIVVMGTGSFKAVREGLLKPRPQLLGVHWRLCVPWFLAASPQFTAFRFMRRSPLTHLPVSSFAGDWPCWIESHSRTSSS